MSKLEGKVALVSGGGRGIGRALCLKLASEGARVVVNDMDADPAAEVIEKIAASGGEAVACVGSVTANGFAEQFIGTALDRFGTLDIIVNNAGYTDDAVIHKMRDDQFDAMIEVHVKAPFRILRAASHHIRERAKAEAEQGIEVFRKVVNISSISGTGGNAGQANYSAAKSALHGMTRTLAKEWGRYKVNVNCVAFGYILTRLSEGVDEKQTINVDGREVRIGVPRQQAEMAPNFIPLGRPGTPEEGADGVYLLCSPESNYISGQLLVVGGGLTG